LTFLINWSINNKDFFAPLSESFYVPVGGRFIFERDFVGQDKTICFVGTTNRKY
jgi:hypothetical protein